ncbi:MarR family winged helix-turn-helix transcriptional regulator [Actinoplanes sp. NPDC049668]|uniref:MarR family winged helix-turn-helix transcriptional regulator n=1 Tax=unclassified Actinoplanes TaxID=2626549 RepID=UPI0033B7EA30
MRPLGYWIKEIDRRIEADLGRLLAEDGLTRRHWQVLHTIEQGPATRAGLDEALAPFADSVCPEVDDLIGRGWAAGAEPGSLTLTGPGRAAHDRIAQRVYAARARVTDGLAEQEYVTLIGLLERVAGNLAPA